MLMNDKENYGSVTKTLHWILAVLVVIMLTVGLLIDKLPHIFGSVHKFTGLVVLGIAVLFILWIQINPRPGYELPRFQIIIAKTVQHVMLLAVLIMPLSGWYFSTAAGKPPHLGSLLLPMPGVSLDRTWVPFALNIHKYVAYTLIGLVSVHTLAALAHHFVYKDNILRRMLRK